MANANSAAPETGRKTRTITLTDRPPVQIVEDEWPIISQARGNSAGPPENEKFATATWTVKVRRHADGRHIVYGVLTVKDGIEQAWSGGCLLPSHTSSMVISAIHACARGVRHPDMAREVIANLPPEVL